MQNRVRNVTMNKANKKALVHLMETEMWRLLIPSETPAVDPQNEFTVDR